ncbi:MAG: lysophospholipid acyltransferase family protein [Chloroflexi bacterium]|nr:lysophospholipid acyltransferase family protein [Chloroflexota bacterium]
MTPVDAGPTRPTRAGPATGNGRETGDSPVPAARAAGYEIRDPLRYQRRGPRLRERIVLAGYRAAVAVLGRLPLGPAARAGGWMAVLVYWLWPPKRRIVQANAAHVLRVAPSDPAAGRLARAVFRNQARWILESLRLGRLKPGQAEASVDTGAWPRLSAARADDGRLIMVGAHLGNGEIGVAAIARHGLPIRLLIDDTAYEDLLEVMHAPRRAWGVELIRWRNLREVYRVLRAGEVLALLVDWGYRPDGLPVRLFGDWTTLPAGPATLGARTGAPLVVVWTIRHPDGSFVAGVGTPVHVASDEPAELVRATQAIADDLERAIGLAPEQWTTFKPIWPADPAEGRRLAAQHAAMAGAAEA